MLKIIKFLKNSWPYILLCVVLLIIQANTDLALPDYTSDIVNIGIQQGGVEETIPNAISENNFNMLELFMSDEEKQQAESLYEKIDKDNFTDKEYGDYIEKYPESERSSVFALTGENEDVEQVIKDSILAEISLANMDESSTLKMFAENMHIDTTGMTLEELAEQMGIPTESGQSITIFTFIKAGAINGYDLRIGTVKELSVLSDMIMSQMEISFVKNEYKALGADMDHIQINYLVITGAKMLGLALLGMIVSIIVSLIAAKVAAKVGVDLRGKLFKRVVSFSNTEMDKFSTASLITRSTNDIQQVQMSIVMILRIVIYAPILGIGGVIRVLQTDTSMAWIIGLAVTVILGIVVVLMFTAMPKFRLTQVLVDRLNLVTREILTGLSVIRAFSRDKHEEERFDIANKDLTSITLFTNRVMTFMMPIMMLIMNGVAVLIVWVGAKGIDNGNIQVGDLMAFITYTMMIIMSFLMITMVSIMLPRATVSALRIDEVIMTEPVIRDRENAKHTDKKGLGAVCFENVSFRYPSAEEDVLSEISFTANPGETTAIIGSTGSGKSTLVQLLPRFYDVTGGRIVIDGTDIRDMKQHDLRAKIGFVPQKGILFSGTIATNLRFGKEEAADDEIREAAEIAQAMDFIEEKTDKFDSEISQGGSNVSGGQKQRLAIARAIAKNPKIYVFDDSFSALDYKTDVALRKALKNKLSDSTVIIVAQRISTIINAEKIIVLDEGKVSGIGTHKELLAGNEIYSQIARSQLSEKELGIEEEGAGNNG